MQMQLSQFIFHPSQKQQQQNMQIHQFDIDFDGEINYSDHNNSSQKIYELGQQDYNEEEVAQLQKDNYNNNQNENEQIDLEYYNDNILDNGMKFFQDDQQTIKSNIKQSKKQRFDFSYDKMKPCNSFKNIMPKKRQYRPFHKGNNYMRVSEQTRQLLLNILKYEPKTSTTDIAIRTMLSRTKIIQIRREFQLTGDVRATEGGNNKSYGRVKQQGRQIQLIKKLATQNPRIGLQQLCEALQKEGIYLKRSSIHKRLTSDLGFQYMPINITNNPIQTYDDENTIMLRGAFCKKLMNYKLQNLYVCGISLFTNTYKCQSAWLPKEMLNINKGLFFPEMINQNEKSVNLLITINQKGVVRSDIIWAQLNEQILAEHLKSGFLSSMKKGDVLLVSQQICQEMYKLHKDKVESSDTYVYSMQSANYSETKLEESDYCQNQYTDSTPISIQPNAEELSIQKAMNSLGINYLCLPFYSPKLNPCYHFLFVVQKKFKAYRTLKKNIRTHQHMKTGVNEVLSLMPLTQHKSYFNKIRNYLSIKGKKDIKLSFFIQGQQQKERIQSKNRIERYRVKEESQYYN